MFKKIFGKSGKSAKSIKNAQIDPKLEALLKEIQHLNQPIDEERRLEALQAAVSLTDRKFQADLWGSLYTQLSLAYENRKNGNRLNNLEQAIEHRHLALEGYTREEYPLQWAGLQTDLADMYADRASGDLADNIEKAIQHGTAALEVFTQQKQAQPWAVVHHNLSRAYVKRYDGDHTNNLQEAKKHADLALQVFTPQDYPNQNRMVNQNLYYIHSKAPLLAPVRPGNVPKEALKDWQISRWREHEAEEAKSSLYRIITDQKFHLLVETPITKLSELNKVYICSSRWVVTQTSKAWNIIDLRSNSIVVTHQSSKGWLEMIHLGPYAAFENKMGVLQITTPPLAMYPYQHATLWEYDTGGDSYGTQYNLATGEKKAVNSSRYDLSSEIWYWNILDFKSNVPLDCALEGPLSDYELSVQPNGWVHLQERNTHALINKLRTSRKNLIAAVITPNCTTLLTISDEFHFDVWHLSA